LHLRRTQLDRRVLVVKRLFNLNGSNCTINLLGAFF
jgi:hypothetical protein